MSAIYCSRGHLNAPENRFCSACGEKLVAAKPGLILGDRYRVVQELGHGGFGRTYLAEDLNRFNENCVLKEFAPQVQGDYALQKAEELFELEAGVLYKLHHSQIPQFRELFRATVTDRDRLFLVQDYVEGRTYRQLLEARKVLNTTFTEIEIRQLLLQILPVLQYIHRSEVIHRDISPDNLILRSSDQRPVLIDFGGVKQIAADATVKYTSSAETAAMTRLGKFGYAPPEQLRQGQVSAQTDLYALAITALVLLTGKEPMELLDLENQLHPWQNFVSLTPELTTVLTKMLAYPVDDRFTSADSVLQVLHPPLEPLPPPTPDPVPAAFSLPPSQLTTRATQVVTPAVSGGHQPIESSTQAVTPAAATRPYRSFNFKWLLLVPLLLFIGAGWWWRGIWLPLLQETTSLTEQPPQPQETLASRAETAAINFPFLIKLTNATFEQRYPEQAGRTLSDTAADAEWRQRWADIADEWVTLLSQNLSSKARQNLGRYSQSDRENWKQRINKLYVGSRSLYDLTDARFFHLFPQQQGEFLDQPIGQVWQAIAVDQIQALEDQSTLKQVEFAPGTFSQQVTGNLASGGGQVYIANLSADQILRLNLQAANAAKLSIYLPRPTAKLPSLLEDSSELTWSGTLPQSGFYEIVIVNLTEKSLPYQLNLAVDSITSTPIEPEEAEAPEAKD